jgi:hypothetical protein
LVLLLIESSFKLDRQMFLTLVNDESDTEKQQRNPANLLSAIVKAVSEQTSRPLSCNPIKLALAINIVTHGTGPVLKELQDEVTECLTHHKSNRSLESAQNSMEKIETWVKCIFPHGFIESRPPLPRYFNNHLNENVVANSVIRFFKTSDPEFRELMIRDSRYTHQEMEAIQRILNDENFGIRTFKIAAAVRAAMEDDVRGPLRKHLGIDNRLHGLHAGRSIAFSLEDGRQVGYLVV